MYTFAPRKLGKMVRWIMVEGTPTYSPKMRFALCKKQFDDTERGLCYIVNMGTPDVDEVIISGRGEDAERIHHFDPYDESPVYYSKSYRMTRKQFDEHFSVIYNDNIHYLEEAQEMYGFINNNNI